MKVRMQGLERRREALEAGLTTVTEPKPRLHPGLAEVYRQKVATLQEALAAKDGHEVRGAIRAGRGDRAGAGGPQAAIEVRGDLAAILALGQNASTRREGRVLRLCLSK